MFFEKYFILIARLSSPKEPVLQIMPWLCGKAMLLIIKEKIVEPLENLVENEPVMRNGHLGVACAENMIYMFCFGLICSPQVGLDVIDTLKIKMVHRIPLKKKPVD